jgi:hypothetical protein
MPKESRHGENIASVIGRYKNRKVPDANNIGVEQRK